MKTAMQSFKHCTIFLMFASMPLALPAQGSQPDTVVVDLARTSRIVFTMQDSNDIWQLKHYDFQALFDDILSRLGHHDGKAAEHANAVESTTPPADVAEDGNDSTEEDNDAGSETHQRPSYKDFDDEPDYPSYWGNHYPRSKQFFNIDFGINDYAEDKNYPDVGQPYYTVHPWGSWYIALSTMNRTRFSDKFCLEASLGVNWYNFKFEADNTLITQTQDGVFFVPDPRNLYFTKSKLTASYVNVSLVPVFNTGHGDHDLGWHYWNHWNNGGFRIGVGPYVGYRLGSHSKQQYEVNGDKQVEKEHDDFYLQNLRYGLRLQIGVRGADFFINYDLNGLFQDGKGPELHPFSFGITF
jgi:hypothetical protein